MSRLTYHFGAEGHNAIEVQTLITLDDGAFAFTDLAAGNWRVYPLEPGFSATPEFYESSLPPSAAGLRFAMKGNYAAEMRDLVIVLQIMAGADPEPAYLPADINGDEKINLVEAAHLMGKITERQ